MVDIAKYKDECYDVMGAIYNVKKELGPGLNEKVYQEGFAMELSMDNIPFERISGASRLPWTTDGI